ncbi:MAG TPA: 30S ribosomal protein S21 [bacterium]|nr:30S ribosomal protein S21 [bacterium]HNS48093.1 30S ribosomal protein S21 [bacterium]
MRHRTRQSDDFEKIFKRFKREVEREKILQEIKSREYYEKPSRQRRLKKLRKKRSR